jgi:hypothetical protein
MDVKSAFLDGDLEEVFMYQPHGFWVASEEYFICRLIESLYNLK